MTTKATYFINFNPSISKFEYTAIFYGGGKACSVKNEAGPTEQSAIKAAREIIAQGFGNLKFRWNGRTATSAKAPTA